MWCNHYMPECIGTQPVRVFTTELFKEFDNIRTALHSWFPSSGLYKINLDYQTGENSLIGPYATTKSIQIDETFLSAFWNYCFGLILATPLGQTNKDEEIKNCNPYDSLQYCSDLFETFKPWNIEQLANPELRKKELSGIINFTNKVFSNGLYFILIHEFAHIIRGDVFKPHTSISESHEMEFACDSYAFEVFANSTDLQNPETIFGILCATGLITYCSTFKEEDTETHPFPDERLMKVLESFAKHSSIERNSNVWNIATWILVTWDFLQKKCFPGGNDSILDVNKNFIDVKATFDETLERLQNKKIWTTN